MQTFLNGSVELRAGDCLDLIRHVLDSSVDSVVTDPPYALVSIVKRFGKIGSAPVKSNDAYARASAGFMGKAWDTGDVAFAVEFWAEVFRVLKPGGHVAAFSGTRTYHRLACAIEDAGFEIRDQLAWAYGTGFPKSLDVSKAIDKAAGAKREVVGEYVSPDGCKRDPRNRAKRKAEGYGLSGEDSFKITAPATDAASQWEGWGTALKPAWEPICLARKPLIGTVAENVLTHGTGALNVDGCRIAGEPWNRPGANAVGGVYGDFANDAARSNDKGRFPANLIHDGSEEVVAGFPETAAAVGGARDSTGCKSVAKGRELPRVSYGHDDAGGSAARFFYSAKADKDDRLGSKHPTVKPVDLMQWLCRLITPPGGLVLDPFAGTGTTGEAAWREGFRAMLFEREAEYQADIARRMGLALAGRGERARAAVKARGIAVDAGPLFGGDDAPGKMVQAREIG